MLEETNLTNTETTETAAEEFNFENIFAEEETAPETATAETGAGEGAQSTEEATEAEKPTAEEAQPETVSAKYNGKEIPLDKGAVTKLAEAMGLLPDGFIATLQKGMNYDHLKTSVDNSQETKALDFLAEAMGVSRKDYVNNLLANQDNFLMQKELSGLRLRLPDVEEATLRELAQDRVKARRSEAAEKRKQVEAEQDQSKLLPWKEFFAKYPKLTPETLPAELLDRVNAGAAPLPAMLELEKGRLETEKAELLRQLEAEKNNKKNKEKALSSQKSVAADEADLFMAGFLSAD